jgi:DNA-binding MarR family transcriptional regulator
LRKLLALSERQLSFPEGERKIRACARSAQRITSWSRIFEKLPRHYGLSETRWRTLQELWEQNARDRSWRDLLRLALLLGMTRLFTAALSEAGAGRLKQFALLRRSFRKMEQRLLRIEATQQQQKTCFGLAENEYAVLQRLWQRREQLSSWSSLARLCALKARVESFAKVTRAAKAGDIGAVEKLLRRNKFCPQL